VVWFDRSDLRSAVDDLARTWAPYLTMSEGSQLASQRLTRCLGSPASPHERRNHGVTGRLGRRRLPRLLMPSLIALAMVWSACTGSDTGPPLSSPPGGQATPGLVRELTSIDALRDAFNADAGSTRLILLISPT
jgi:hypothetical protein